MSEDRQFGVLLGASNLTLLLPHLLAHLQASVLARNAAGADGPETVFAAAGHGRALTLPSRFLLRQLDPSVAACEHAVSESGFGRRGFARPRRLLVMDLGLDLLYGASVGQLVGSIGHLLGGVIPAGDTVLGTRSAEPPTVAIERPPTARIESLDAGTFALLRRLFFPGHRVDRLRLLDGLHRLDERLEELSRGAPAVRLVSFPEQFYGWDPIHVRTVRRREAAALLAEALDVKSDGHAALSTGARVAWLVKAWPTSFRVAGVRLRRRQPCWRSGELSVHLV